MSMVNFLKRLCSAILPVLLELLADFVSDYFGGEDDEG